MRARGVGVASPRASERLDHGIEALDRNDRIEILGAAGRERQIIRNLVRCGEKHTRAPPPHFVSQCEETRLRRTAQREDEQRIALVDQRHRPVTQLGARERFGLDPDAKLRVGVARQRMSSAAEEISKDAGLMRQAEGAGIVDQVKSLIRENRRGCRKKGASNWSADDS